MIAESSFSKLRPPKIPKACDCCHARKVRCDGTHPCDNCCRANLPCTYLYVPKKKGPKGPSKRFPLAVLRMQIEQKAAKTTLKQHSSPETTSSRTTPSLARASEAQELPIVFTPSPLLSLEVALRYIDFFFDNKYPVTPIIHRGHFYSSLSSFSICPETYALVASICAAMRTVMPQNQSSSSSPLLSAKFFISEARRARQYRDYFECPRLADVHISFLLSSALFNDRNSSMWGYLREAISLLQLMRLDDENTYSGLDDIAAKYSRMTFWALFVTERALALQRNFPLALHRTIALPTISAGDSDAPVILGFIDLISLFHTVNYDVISWWNKSSHVSNYPTVSLDESSLSWSQLAAVQSSLTQGLPEISKRNEIQQVDLLVSREWLHLVFWQLAMANDCLSSCSKDVSMNFSYPVTIARDVIVVCHKYKSDHFDPHGPGIIEKIFDVGCSLADVLQLQPNAPGIINTGLDVGPKDYLIEMLNICSQALCSSSSIVTLLALKANECLNIGPRSMDSYRTENELATPDDNSNKTEHVDQGMDNDGNGLNNVADGNAFFADCTQSHELSNERFEYSSWH